MFPGLTITKRLNRSMGHRQMESNFTERPAISPQVQRLHRRLFCQFTPAIAFPKTVAHIPDAIVKIVFLCANMDVLRIGAGRTMTVMPYNGS